jgi:hypothetical protein
LRARGAWLGLLCVQAAHDPVYPPEHLGRGATGEGEQQDPARIGAHGDAVGNAVGQGRRLAGAGACDNEQWFVAVKHGQELLVVEAVQDRPDGGYARVVTHLELWPLLSLAS